MVQNQSSITILLATYNGARFLNEQLQSLARQTHSEWRLIVSDDGSSDDTLDIVERFAMGIPQPVEVRTGPRRGACGNFISLVTDRSIEGEYVAFCDQDDIWFPQKLARSLDMLRQVPRDVPAAYGSRTRLVDEHGRPSGYSPLFKRCPSFENSLVQSIAGGNTMLLNREAKRLLEQAGSLEVVSHDWWTYQLVTGNGGRVLYDPVPSLDYRQHGQNAIGGNRSLAARVKRIRMAIDGRLADWNDLNVAALNRCRHLLNANAIRTLDAYIRMRDGGFSSRVDAFLSTSIRRQSRLGNIALMAAIVARKI